MTIKVPMTVAHQIKLYLQYASRWAFKVFLLCFDSSHRGSVRHAKVQNVFKAGTRYFSYCTCDLQQSTITQQNFHLPVSVSLWTLCPLYKHTATRDVRTQPHSYTHTGHTGYPRKKRADSLWHTAGVSPRAQTQVSRANDYLDTDYPMTTERNNRARHPACYPPLLMFS